MKETGLFSVEPKQELWVSDDGSRSFRRAGDWETRYPDYPLFNPFK